MRKKTQSFSSITALSKGYLTGLFWCFVLLLRENLQLLERTENKGSGSICFLLKRELISLFIKKIHPFSGLNRTDSLGPSFLKGLCYDFRSGDWFSGSHTHPLPLPIPRKHNLPSGFFPLNTGLWFLLNTSPAGKFLLLYTLYCNWKAQKTSFAGRYTWEGIKAPNTRREKGRRNINPLWRDRI